MRKVLMPVFAALVLAAACTSGPEGPTAGEATPEVGRIVELPVGAEGDPIPLEPAGVLVNKYDLDLGWCFNQYSAFDESGVTAEETRVVDCSEPHESEVYLQLVYPGAAGAPYPGEDEIVAWSERQCYDAFEEFVGLQYELSVLEIGTLQPTFETWTGAGLHREVTCFVYSYDGNALQGRMGSTGL